MIGVPWTQKEEDTLKNLWPLSKGGLIARCQQIANTDALTRHPLHGIEKKAITLGLWEQAHGKPRDRPTPKQNLRIESDGESSCPVINKFASKGRPLSCLIELMDRYHRDAADDQTWEQLIAKAYKLIDSVYEDIDAARRDYGRFKQRLDDPCYKKWIAERLQKEQDGLDNRIKQDMIVDRELKNLGRY